MSKFFGRFQDFVRMEKTSRNPVIVRQAARAPDLSFI
jgi:hypothetical protein